MKSHQRPRFSIYLLEKLVADSEHGASSPVSTNPIFFQKHTHTQLLLGARTPSSSPLRRLVGSSTGLSSVSPPRTEPLLVSRTTCPNLLSPAPRFLRPQVRTCPALQQLCALHVRPVTRQRTHAPTRNLRCSKQVVALHEALDTPSWPETEHPGIFSATDSMYGKLYATWVRQNCVFKPTQ